MIQTKVWWRIKTHILSSVTPPRKPCRLWDDVEKVRRAGHTTDMTTWRMRIVCWITRLQIHTQYITRLQIHTQYITRLQIHTQYIYCLRFFTATVFTRTRHNVTLYVHLLALLRIGLAILVSKSLQENPCSYIVIENLPKVHRKLS